MQVKQLDHLNLTVGDFNETADWYRRVFGFEVVQDERDAQGNRWGVLRGGEAMLCIYEHPELKWEEHAERGVHGINHFGLRITDGAAWEETMRREHVELSYGKVRWPHSTAWYVVDPTGYEIEVALWDDDTVRFG